MTWIRFYKIEQFSLLVDLVEDENFSIIQMNSNHVILLL